MKMLNVILSILLMFNFNILPQAEEIASAVDNVDTEMVQNQQYENEIKMMEEYNEIVKETSNEDINIIQKHIQKMKDEATTKLLKLIFTIIRYLMLIVLIDLLMLYARFEHSL